jgi:hypothetical protein
MNKILLYILLLMSAGLLSMGAYFQFQYVRNNHQRTWLWFLLTYGLGFLSGICLGTAILSQRLNGITLVTAIVFCGVLDAVLVGNGLDHRIRNDLMKHQEMDEGIENKE